MPAGGSPQTGGRSACPQARARRREFEDGVRNTSPQTGARGRSLQRELAGASSQTGGRRREVAARVRRLEDGVCSAKRRTARRRAVAHPTRLAIAVQLRGGCTAELFCAGSAGGCTAELFCAGCPVQGCAAAPRLSDAAATRSRKKPPASRGEVGGFGD